MNTKAIETAHDPDLRAVPRALARAAQRARELAARTGTHLIIVEQGLVKRVAVAAASESPATGVLRVQERAAPPYGDTT